MHRILYIFNSKNIKRSIAVCFVITTIMLILIPYTQRVSSSREALFEYYNYIPPDTVDVLCVGSSHIYCSINPSIMFRDYGIAAFDIAAGFQPMWCSYYYIEEVLKKQNPKCIILDVYTACFGNEAFQDTVQMNLNGMRLSNTKWKALTEYSCANKWEILLEFPITHSNYDKIDADDYNINLEWYMGYSYMNNIASIEMTDLERDHILKISDKAEISCKSEEWLIKIIKLCRRRDIKLVLVNAPIPVPNESLQKNINYIADIAKNNDIPFLDGCENYKQINIDYNIDSLDDNHINYYGANKYTKWICTYLMDKVNLPDRRYNDRYEYWKITASKIDNIIDEQNIYNEPSLVETIKRMKRNGNYMYALIYTGGTIFKKCNIEEYQSMAEWGGVKLDEAGIYLFDENKMKYCSLEKDKYYYYLPADIIEFNIEADEINYKINGKTVKNINLIDEDSNIYIICYNKLIGKNPMYFQFLARDKYVKGY